MAITQAICSSFKQEILVGTHNLTLAANAMKIALYQSSATIGASTTLYAVGTAGQASGTGYTAGGAALTNVTPVLSGITAMCDFADVTWTTSSITARGALIYNSSSVGTPATANRAVAVLDFGSDKTSTAGDFTVQFPAATVSEAIIRIV